METTNRRIEAENTKARTILFDRIVFGLAKQAVESLEGEDYQRIIFVQKTSSGCCNRG